MAPMAKSPPIDLIPTSAPEPLVDLLYDSALTVPVNKRNNFAATRYVRFLLAFVVIVSHARWYCNFSVPFIKVWPDAQAGVLGFFVLSGWVIASSVNRETK
jgi:peptidoglycan/LPS O-acetylase OafA/YrhL